MPLPYITRELKDRRNTRLSMQRRTVLRLRPRRVSFYPPSSTACAGVDWAFVTLHIGPGTFQPVREEDIRQHEMHREYYRVGAEAAQQINNIRKKGGRIVAVGTTVCRVLEDASDAEGYLKETARWTDLFIYPGYRFKAVDILLTNFHLPRSTLLMLVCAFAGHERVMEAYRTAVAKNYRFFSFGDSMLLL